eukprot:10648874-Alexandrium_andersonii.AAC.1
MLVGRPRPEKVRVPENKAGVHDIIERDLVVHSPLKDRAQGDDSAVGGEHGEKGGEKREANQPKRAGAHRGPEPKARGAARMRPRHDDTTPNASLRSQRPSATPPGRPNGL